VAAHPPPYWRILSATVREKAGRWPVPPRLEISGPWQPETRTGAVGVDAGIGTHLLVVMHPTAPWRRRCPTQALRGALADLR
jgi:hypothetical protein